MAKRRKHPAGAVVPISQTKEEKRAIIETAREVSKDKQADTKAALAKPSELTPLQIKRLARSQAKREALQQKRKPAEPN